MKTVSVLMPTYNQCQFLPRALAGLVAQEFTDFELIACNDGSTDETASVLQAAGVRTIAHTRNRGAASAINSAKTLATGQLLTWVSSDNVMHADWLSVLVEHLDQNPNRGAVYSAYRRCEGGKIIDQYPGEYDPDKLMKSEACYFGPSFLIRREVWQEHRGNSAHDFDNWARVEEACQERGMTIGYVPRPLCDYHAGPWCTGRARPDLYDAARWRAEAMERRCALPSLPQ